MFIFPRDPILWNNCNFLSRNELDELEADRLASVAAAEQSIEDLRTKFKEANRIQGTNKNKNYIYQ